jgi:hypothetical protein
MSETPAPASFELPEDRHDSARTQPAVSQPTLDLSDGWPISLNGTYPALPIGDHDPEDLPKELVGAYLHG